MIRVTVITYKPSTTSQFEEQPLSPAATKPQIHALYLDGHADLARGGQSDVLCAAVSVLCENLAHSLQILLQLPLDVQVQNGSFKITLDISHTCAESDLLFAATILGLRTLSEQYPQRLQFEEEVIYGS